MKKERTALGVEAQEQLWVGKACTLFPFKYCSTSHPVWQVSAAGCLVNTDAGLINFCSDIENCFFVSNKTEVIETGRVYWDECSGSRVRKGWR